MSPVDEFEHIAEIRRRLEMGWSSDERARDIAVGIGDDAAILTASPGRQVLSVDTMVENVHFRRTWLTGADLGFRSVSAAISDLAAMGARPRGGLLSLIVPTTLPSPALFELIDGVAEASRHYEMPMLGGNLSAGGELSLTTTVIGEVGERVLLRSGARPGEHLFITGHPGSAALGLALLARERADEADGIACLARWRRPLARVHEARALVGIASSAIDVSDGLLQDLEHLCAASGVGVRLRSRDLPLTSAYLALAARLGLDGHRLALTGGEDYELLFTAPPDRPLPIAATPIGIIETQAGLRIEDREGHCAVAEVAGFRHPIGN
jgi:thiamine-monophosphate kinase